MFGNYGYYDGGWMLFGGFVMILFSIFFILLLVWLVYTVVNKDNIESSKKEKNSMQIAKARYAKGEIKKEEYEDIMKTLKK